MWVVPQTSQTVSIMVQIGAHKPGPLPAASICTGNPPTHAPGPMALYNLIKLVILTGRFLAAKPNTCADG